MKTKTLQPVLTQNNLLTSHRKPQDGAPPKTAWLVGPPKSGSTWMSQLLMWALMWPTASLVPRGFARRAQEIVVPPGFDKIVDNIFIPHHHTKATEPTLNFLKEYKVGLMLMTRNMYDNTISLVDHLTNDGIGVPIAFVPKSFRTESFEKRCDIVASLLMPWYISFYASWAYAQADGIPIHIVPYETLHRDTISTLASALTFLDEMRNINVLNRAMKEGGDKTLTRFNRGEVGRGLRELPDSAKRIIDHICTAHTDPTINNFLKYVYETPSSTTLAATTESGSRGVLHIPTSTDNATGIANPKAFR